jgi:hypothetical protein
MTKLSYFSTLASALWLAGCSFGIDGNGERVEETRETSTFSRVRSNCELDVRITQSSERSVTVSLDSNLTRHVTTHVSDDTLYVDLDENIDDHVSGPHVLITTPELSAAKLDGSGDMSITFDAPELPLDLYLTGSGDMTYSGTSAALGAYLDGSGDLRLEGRTSDIDMKLDGSGDIRGARLEAQSGNLALDGSGDLTSTITDSAQISLSGSGDIDLYGGAHIEQYHHDGSGDLNTH